jgi:hypothetical protein
VTEDWIDVNALLRHVIELLGCNKRYPGIAVEPSLHAPRRRGAAGADASDGCRVAVSDAARGVPA